MYYIDTTDRIETVEEVLSEPLQYRSTGIKIHVHVQDFVIIVCVIHLTQVSPLACAFRFETKFTKKNIFETLIKQVNVHPHIHSHNLQIEGQVTSTQPR